MLLKVAKSRILWTALALVTLYWVLVLTLPYRLLSESLNWVRFALAGLVLVIYAPHALEALTVRRVDKTHQLVLGIVLGWFAWVSVSVWGAYGRYVGLGVNIAESTVTGMFAWLTILAAVLHLTAPTGLHGDIPTHRWRLVTVGVGLGCLMAGIALASAWWSTR